MSLHKPESRADNAAPANGANCRRLHELLSVQAAARPDAPALWWQGQAMDYATLEQRSSRLAARLAACGQPGDRIAVLAWNCPEFVELIYAAAAAGKILVPLNARLAPSEWLYQLESADVHTVFGDDALLQSLRGHPDCPATLETIGLATQYRPWLDEGDTAELPATDDTDPVWILYTSGTTGRPKGAVLTHRSFLAGLRSGALGRPVMPDDTYLYPFPLFHVAAHNVLLQHQYGAAVVLLRSFDAAATLQACRELRVSTMSLAPTMIGMLLDHPDFDPQDLATVRTIGYGASAMPESLLRRLQACSNVGLCQGYGMTELSGSAAFLTPRDHALAAGSSPQLLRSVGKPLATVELKVVNEQGDTCNAGSSGEILVRAQQCMREYWQQPEATAATLAGGWLHTGDIGRFDQDGYLYIVDRKKDMLISGGENIASREVEEVLRSHPAVADCAVIGLPDPHWGEAVCAIMTMRQAASDEMLEAHCRQQLASYKTPRYWLRLDSLPVNAGGKIDKALLRDTDFLRSHGLLQ